MRLTLAAATALAATVPALFATAPTSAAPALTWKSLSAGKYHTCAITTGGAAYCWGSNNYGQLGDLTTTNRSVPTRVYGLSSGVATISAGYYHTCATLTSGAVKCWGLNNMGRLGDGTTIDRVLPTTVIGLAATATSVAAGGVHTCALLSTRAVQCWGSGSRGTLGNGKPANVDNYSYTPVTVVGGIAASALTAGRTHNCIISTAGAAYCWGEGQYGRIGIGSGVNQIGPVTPTGLTSGVTSISAGEYHTCAVRNGAATCFGGNSYGQLGSGTDQDIYTPNPVVTLTSGVTRVTAGSFSACALLTGGRVKCWGENYDGTLGNGSHTGSAIPVQTIGLTSGVGGVDLGGSHGCARITTTSTIKCWGYNEAGQVGNGTTTDQLTPVPIRS